jgi:hypothetical protein
MNGWIRLALQTALMILLTLAGGIQVEASGLSRGRSCVPCSGGCEKAAAALEPKDAPQDAKDGNTEPSLDKLGFGLGLGFRWNVLSPDLVDEAEIDANGVVRVTKRANTHTGFVVETHYLVKRNCAATFGVGPFVAAEAGSDAIITSVSLGVLFAWKVDDHGRGFGLGVGYSAQPAAKVLGPEFVEGQPAPKGPDDKPLPIRLQQRDKGAIQLILSVVF